MYGVYAKSTNNMFLFIISVVLMSPGSSWESVPKVITLFPARTQSKWPGLVYICLDYLCKGCRNFLGFWLHRAAASRCSWPLGWGCLLVSGYLEVIFTDATKLVGFSKA